MKKIFIVLSLLSAGCSSHHPWMENANVGYVEGDAIVLFDAGIRNGTKYYRPQFQSDCHYNKTYFDEQSSTGCLIREDRVNGIHPYYTRTQN